MQADLLTTNCGSIISIEAATRRGKRWLADNVPDSHYGTADCDHRCGIDILLGAIRDGLVLEDTETGRTANRATAASLP